MTRITIRELHTHTGRYVRTAHLHPLIITDRGEEVAMLKPVRGPDLQGKAFPERKARELPRVKLDSSILIAADREGR